MADLMDLKGRPYNVALQIAANIIQNLEPDCQKESLDSLRIDVHRYCELIEQLKCFKSIRKQYREKSKILEEQAAQGEQTEEVAEQRTKDWEDVIKAFNEEVEKIAVDTSNNQDKKNFDRQFDQLVSSLTEEQAPNVSEDDMEIRGEVNVICPISKRRMAEPMKNELCGHVYDRNSVLEMIKQNERTRCPVVGCSNSMYLKEDHLSLDIVTKIYIEKNA